MILSTDESLSPVSQTEYEHDAQVDVKDNIWLLLSDQETLKDILTLFDVTSFAQDPKMNNPCQIRPGVSQSDVSVTASDTLPFETKMS